MHDTVDNLPMPVRRLRSREAELVEENQARFILEHAGLPGHEVHDDGDAVWQTSEGAAWTNAGTRLRFTPRDATSRLETIVRRYVELRRPGGFWVGPHTTPDDLGGRLTWLGFRCRKRFPGMHCDLRRLAAAPKIRGLVLEAVTDFARFDDEPHPAIGPVTTPLRRSMLQTQQLLCARASERALSLLASLNGIAVATALLYLDGDGAGLWDVGVLESHRNRGIGTALTAYACVLARDAGYRDCVLIASGMGFGVYRRVGFEEVCRLSFWYSRLGRNE